MNLTEKDYMIDTHVHIGQFDYEYYAPEEIYSILNEAGIDSFIFSSTTSCKNDVSYEEIEEEINIIYSKCKANSDKVKPLFWVIPEKGFDKIVYDSLPYCGFKIHPCTHNWDLSNTMIDKLCNEIFEFASEKKLPVLLHTGYDEIDESKKFEKYFDKYNNINFILAHGRPLKQALAITKKYHNVYVDTAFMPISEIRILLENNLVEKILFGTDFPITHYFSNRYKKKLSLNDQYRSDLSILKSITDQQKNIIKKNIIKLYY